MITNSDRELASHFVLALSDLDDIDVVIDPIAASRERGRPPLPKDEQKAKINITIDNDLLKLLNKNKSKHINAILRQALAKES